MHGRRAEVGVVRAGKRFTLFILNQDVDNVIRIINSQENSAILIDGITETVRHQIKNQEGGFVAVLLAPMATSLIALVTSSIVGGIFGKGVTRAGREYSDKDHMD